MCKSLFTCVLIAVLVLEAAAAEPQNDDVFERKIEDYDIPEFELLEWPDSRSLLNRTLKQNTNFRSISKENPLVVINDTRQKSSKKTSQEIDTTDSSYRITVPYVVPNTQINIPESVGIRPVNSVDPALYSNKPTDNTNIEPITIVHKPDTISGASDGVPASTKPPVSNIKPLASVKPVTSGHVPTSSTNKPSASTSSGIRIKPAVNSAKPSVSKPVAGVKPALTTAKPVATTTKSKKKKGNKQQQTSPSSGGLAPCKCLYGVCTCCTGPLLDLFQQKFCMKVVYTPEDFAFDYALMLNNRVMYQDKLSGKNPRPACISLPRFSSLRLCARFSNIYFAGRNVHMCLGLEGQWNSLELFSTNFDCLRLGAQGLAVVKPEDGGGISPAGVVAGYDSIIEAGDDIEDYDENVVRALFGSFY